jgi:DNA-directed RNA polymerase subunit M/transcription elongation factor TFIIS
MMNIEDIGWKKDDTLYIIFPCNKCEQYMYVKESQKTKKCLRCGYSHQINTIKNSGEYVRGMTKAVEIVKKKQEEMAIKKLGIFPEFRSFNDFLLTKKKLQIQNSIRKDDEEDEKILKFRKMLLEISKDYSEFPFYIIELKAESYGFRSSELKKLTRKLEKEGTLIRKNNKNNYNFRH